MPTVAFPSRRSRIEDTQAVTVAALRATARLTGDMGWSSLAEQTTDQIARA